MQVSLNATGMVFLCLGLLILILGIYGIGKSHAECDDGKEPKNASVDSSGGYVGLGIGLTFVIVGLVIVLFSRTESGKSVKFNISKPKLKRYSEEE